MTLRGKCPQSVLNNFKQHYSTMVYNIILSRTIISLSISILKLQIHLGINSKTDILLLRIRQHQLLLFLFKI